MRRPPYQIMWWNSSEKKWLMTHWPLTREQTICTMACVMPRSKLNWRFWNRDEVYSHLMNGHITEPNKNHWYCGAHVDTEYRCCGLKKVRAVCACIDVKQINKLQFQTILNNTSQQLDATGRLSYQWLLKFLLLHTVCNVILVLCLILICNTTWIYL